MLRFCLSLALAGLLVAFSLPFYAIVGAILLTTCAVMVVLGSTLLAGRLQGLQFLTYWTWCMLLAIAAIIIALWDLLLIRRISKRTHRELFRQQFLSHGATDKLRKPRNP